MSVDVRGEPQDAGWTGEPTEGERVGVSQLCLPHKGSSAEASQACSQNQPPKESRQVDLLFIRRIDILALLCHFLVRKDELDIPIR